MHPVKKIERAGKALSDLLALEKQAHDLGFIWPHLDMILDQAISECQEIKEAVSKGYPAEKIQEEIGDLLHAAVSLCYFAGYDLEETLSKNVQKFSARLLALKDIMQDSGLKTLEGQPIEFMLALWDKAKQQSKIRPLYDSHAKKELRI
jgi:uncharacterized protein YabN with tetrapyrrole methylase and pyrophosphatase domain